MSAGELSERQRAEIRRLREENARIVATGRLPDAVLDAMTLRAEAAEQRVRELEARITALAAALRGAVLLYEGAYGDGSPLVPEPEEAAWRALAKAALTPDVDRLVARQRALEHLYGVVKRLYDLDPNDAASGAQEGLVAALAACEETP